MQIVPSNILTGIIKHYLFLDSKGAEAKNLRLFSDGYNSMVYTSNTDLSLAQNNNKLPNSFLYGQISQFKDLVLSSNASLVIVVFQPAGIKKLLKIPAFELRDHIVDLRDIFGRESLEMENKLAEAKTVYAKCNVLNAFFSSIALKNRIEKEQIVSSATNFIRKNKGLVSNGQLVKFTGYSERHIERLFMESIGINPKNFANIIRLHHFLQQVKTGPYSATLTGMAYHAGYADQSHLIREFKKHTGMTPGSYKKNPNKLALNLVTVGPKNQ